jgi:ribonucleoside-diphosphate reductase alpha chain
MLGYEYLDRTDLVHVITEQKGVIGNPQMGDEDINPDTSNVYEPTKTVPVESGSSSKKQGMSLDLSMGVQSDAPSCNVCGHTTVRSGTCYKCLNCGNSMGCS